MRHYDFKFGLLFVGNSQEEVAAGIERHLNPVPYIKEQPKKAHPRRRK